jgi:hypothetical protein
VRPWNASEGRVGQRHMPRPPISALIDASRQSNFLLRASAFAAIITSAATPDSHPDCRATLCRDQARAATGSCGPRMPSLRVAHQIYRRASSSLKSERTAGDEARADVFDYIERLALDDWLFEPYGVRTVGWISLSGCQQNRVLLNESLEGRTH